MRVIIAAYNQTLADKFSRKARRIARERIPVSEERMAAEDWETMTGGGLRAVGVGSGITGQGGNLIVIDDPCKSREEANSESFRERVWDWYTDDLYTRLEPDGALILIMTRWHEDDLAGRILASEDGPSWSIINLPAEAEEDEPQPPLGLGRKQGEALCPERFDLNALHTIRTVLGNEYYALYQQRPQPPEGNQFKKDWFGREVITGMPSRHNLSFVIQAWDTAFKDGQQNDYSACVTLGVFQNRIYVLSVYLAKLTFPALVQAMKDQAAVCLPNVILIEDKGSGTSALQTLKRETMLPVVPVAADLDKVARANLVTPICESGRVILPYAQWADDFLDRLIRFPSGKFDDDVDAFVHALSRLSYSVSDVSIFEY